MRMLVASATGLNPIHVGLDPLCLSWFKAHLFITAWRYQYAAIRAAHMVIVPLLLQFTVLDDLKRIGREA